MAQKPGLLRFLFYTTMFGVKYFTVGTWVRVKWHYLRWRGKKYYL